MQGKKQFYLRFRSVCCCARFFVWGRSSQFQHWIHSFAKLKTWIHPSQVPASCWTHSYIAKKETTEMMKTKQTKLELSSRITRRQSQRVPVTMTSRSTHNSSLLLLQICNMKSYKRVQEFYLNNDRSRFLKLLFFSSQLKCKCWKWGQYVSRVLRKTRTFY